MKGQKVLRNNVYLGRNLLGEAPQKILSSFDLLVLIVTVMIGYGAPTWIGEVRNMIKN
jgi:hypothetical protein